MAAPDPARGSPLKTLPPARGPRNTTTRADRVGAWNAARGEGLRFQPERLTGRDARYRWLDAIVASDLPPTTRLVAHTLALHGRANGTSIFPSTRRLSTASGLSERAVCAHLDVLVRRGFLNREARHGNTAGARGFRYLLFAPKVLTAGQHSTRQNGTPQPGARGVAVLTDDQHQPPVLTERQHSADPGAVGADAGDGSVLTHGQRIQELPIHRPTDLPPRGPARATEGARAPGRRDAHATAASEDFP